MSQTNEFYETFLADYQDFLSSLPTADEDSTKEDLKDLVNDFDSLSTEEKREFLLTIQPNEDKILYSLLQRLLNIFVAEEDFNDLKTFLENLFTRLYNNDRLSEEVKRFFATYSKQHQENKICFLNDENCGVVCKIFTTDKTMIIPDGQVLLMTFVNGEEEHSQIPAFDCPVCNDYCFDPNNAHPSNVHLCLLPRFVCEKCNHIFTPLEPGQRVCSDFDHFGYPCKTQSRYKPKTEIGKKIYSFKEHQSRLMKTGKLAQFRYILTKEIKRDHKRISLASIFETPTGHLRQAICPMVKVKLIDQMSDQKLIELIQTSIIYDQRIIFELSQQSFFCYHCIQQHSKASTILPKQHRVSSCCQKCDQTFCFDHKSPSERWYCLKCSSIKQLNEDRYGSLITATNKLFEEEEQSFREKPRRRIPIYKNSPKPLKKHKV